MNLLTLALALLLALALGLITGYAIGRRNEASSLTARLTELEQHLKARDDSHTNIVAAAVQEFTTVESALSALQLQVNQLHQILENTQSTVRTTSTEVGPREDSAVSPSDSAEQDAAADAFAAYQQSLVAGADDSTFEVAPDWEEQVDQERAHILDTDRREDFLSIYQSWTR